MKQSIFSIQFVITTTLCVFISFGCDNSFTPLENDKNMHFSMYGAFDLSADTQWVRVMPVMDSLVWRNEKPIDAEVRLVQTRTGQEIQLDDSLFIFQKGYYAWNFWTIEELVEGEEYQLIATNKDGLSSSATFQIPNDFPTPLVQYSRSSESGNVYGSSIDKLVVADGIYRIQYFTNNRWVGPKEVRISHLEEVQYDGNGGFEFRLSDRGAIADKFDVRNREISILDGEVQVVAGNEDWPNVLGLVQEEIVLPKLNSNVENGLGVVSGVVSKKVPMESCYDEQGELIACPLIN